MKEVIHPYKARRYGEFFVKRAAEGEKGPYKLPKDPWVKLNVLVGLDVRYYAQRLEIDFSVGAPKNMPSTEELQQANIEYLFHDDRCRAVMIFESFEQVRTSYPGAEERALKMMNAGKEYKAQILAKAGILDEKQGSNENVHPKERNKVPNPPPASTEGLRCLFCRFGTELDDAVVSSAQGSCFCLRCFARETKNERPMPSSLRDEVRDVVNSLD